MRNHFACLVLSFVFAGVTVAIAQAPPSAPFVTHQVAPNVYWVEGGGGNSTVIVGDTGVIVVDAKTSPAGGKELLDDIGKITPKPVKTVILTHSDGDHVNGLASFPAGITIIAHEGNKAEQDAALKAGGRGAPPADHQPTRIVLGKGDDVTLDGVKLRLLHWAPAHTSGDLVVFVPALKFVIAGDILTGNMPDPLIHLEKNGSSLGWIETVKGMVGLAADRYLTGHGDIQTKAEVEQRLAGAEAKRAKIVELVTAGKNLDEIRATVGDPPSAQSGGQPGRPNFPSFTEVVYRELTK